MMLAALVSLLSLVVASIPSVAAASAPAVAISRFESLPGRLSYFDDSAVVLYHDSIRGRVLRSPDEGKTWAPVAGPPSGSAYMLIEHPYDKRMAFILSSGKSHWRSADRGATWQEFKTPEAPAVRAGPPLEFNADQKHYEHIIFTGKKCKPWTPWGGNICHDEAYVTTDGFASDPKPLIEFLVHCSWAKATPEIQVSQDHLKRIFCIAWEDSPNGRRSSSLLDDPSHIIRSDPHTRHAISPRASAPTRLFYSDDFYKSRKLVELDMGRDAKNFVGLGPSKRYLVTALRDAQGSSGTSPRGEEMALFVSKDGDRWLKAKFPHGHGLRENAYTIVDSTLHSLVVDVLDGQGSSTGVLFTSDSDGVHFVKSLDKTRRNSRGIVDFEHLENIEGVAIANVIADDSPSGRLENQKVRSMITWDDGSRWAYIRAPKTDSAKCNVDNVQSCSLNLHSVSKPHNLGRVFSSTAPGFVMAVGSIGDRLLPYEECDTFLSTDAGKSWRLVSKDAHKYEFGDQGGILVIVDDEDSTDHVNYSFDQGKTWQKLSLGLKMRAKILTTIPDSTSLKFLLVGTQARIDAGSKPRHVAAFLDFATVGKRKCAEKDFEKWYAEDGGTNEAKRCLMGHKQWYKRRKADADCIVGDKFNDPVGREDPCPCTDADYECDFGYVADDAGKCVPTTKERVPAGECTGGRKTYQGSSGYRKIPGNTCDASRGVRKDQEVSKPCSEGAPDPGTIAKQRHEFPSHVVDYAWFSDSSTLLVQVEDGSIWESKNDGASWTQRVPDPVSDDPHSRFLTIAMHEYDKERGYLITSDQYVWYTTNGGKKWLWFTTPAPANGLGLQILRFHPEKSDWLIWTSSEGCIGGSGDECHARAWYTLDHGRNWHSIDKYVKTCDWARGKNFPVDSQAIICESYKNKRGSQLSFDASNNELQLIWGSSFYRDKKILLDSVVGYAVFEEFMIAAELRKSTGSLALKVSMDGHTFAEAGLPPNLKLDDKAYTILDSVTKSIFLHVTTHAARGSEWGTILKSNGNGTYYALSQEMVNRNELGFVDFEKMLGLDGIALINVVSNADDAAVSGRKQLQTRITHNDGGRWKSLVPPRADAFGQPYTCNHVGCSLHLHGFTERDDPRNSLSSPSAVGLMLAVGNVGEKLAPYQDSDTFLTRDGGFTWEEVHKDAHKWEFGDQGSIILLVNDEEPTDEVLYSLNEGLKWDSFRFGERLRVKNILTVPEDTRRKFVLLGDIPGAQSKSVAVHLDFSALSTRKCVLNPQRPEADDFELWSPSEEREESCLFGRQTHYYRRKRSADCYVGEKLVQPHSIARNCTCKAADFECEFNHYRNAEGKCVQHAGTAKLTSDPYEQCQNGEDYWYERTNMRKIPYSSCDGGSRPDRGPRHPCPMSTRRHGFLWWTTVILSPFVLAGLVGFWWSKRNTRARGAYGSIRLPEPERYSDSPAMQLLVSVPWAVIGLASTAWAWAIQQLDRVPFLSRPVPRTRVSYGGYRGLAQEEDAAILRDYDDEDFEGPATDMR
ncbi:unnamed protein product [Parajaminaea phylloscopi]